MKMNRLGKWLPRVSACTTTTLMLGLAMAACLTRPVGTQPPTTKVNFTSTQSQQAVDKVDMLFAIDNSASMGDKQDFLATAVPVLLNGLLFPHCVDANGNITDDSRADPVKTKAEHYGCAVDAEFKPVTDLHIGIVSSSLGTLGGGLNGVMNQGTPNEFNSDLCPVTLTNKYDNSLRHMNDNAHLLTRAANPDASVQAGALAALQPAGFLAWFPESEENTSNPLRHPTPANPINNSNDLTNYFQSAVKGIGQDGCGLEAQLESMYRFLIQPDPYTTIRKDGNKQADLGDGIDYDLLAQRAQFLRPDSLVAVVMLTDETDSSVDPLSVNGLGFNYASGIFQGSTTLRNGGAAGTTAPMPTSICATDPGNANCTSCGLKAGCADGDTSALCQMLRSDTNCNTVQPGAAAAGYYGPNDDAMNVRMYQMKRRFGVDPQFPISRYVSGLTSARVPDRSTEHTITTSASGVRNISAYVGTGKCTNPLFAAKLPTKQGDPTCDLPKGTRDASLVFYAIVGGVPNELIYGTTADGKPDYRPDDPDHNAMTDAKWTAVLGRDPLRYDTTGIDPHMIESTAPRAGIGGGDPASPLGSNGTDPLIGREWNTGKNDLEYACTFPLKGTGRDCKGDAKTNPNYISCDCTSPATGNQPLCASDVLTNQIRAKAYPTIRELEVARALGAQGITASLCPVDPALSNTPNPDPGTQAAPTFGYNPAVASIIDRLKNALTQQCLPQSLRDPVEAGATPDQLSVDCLILAQLTDQQDCTAAGLKDPDPAVLTVFHQQQVDEAGSNPSTDASDLVNRKVCTVPQAPTAPGETCKGDPLKSWCYVENSSTTKPAGRCQQAIIFSAGTQALAGARFSLQCIRQYSAGVAAGDTH